MSDGAWFGVYSGDTRRYSIDLHRLERYQSCIHGRIFGRLDQPGGVVWTEDLMTSINVVKVVIVVRNVKIVRATRIAEAIRAIWIA